MFLFRNKKSFFNYSLLSACRILSFNDFWPLKFDVFNSIFFPLCNSPMVIEMVTNLRSALYFHIFQVTHLEPWEKGSRKTAGQTGMCGGVSSEVFYMLR